MEITDVTEDHVKVSWLPPQNDGGSPLTGYLIEKSEAKRPRWLRVGKVTPNNMSYEISDLVENTEYYFRVKAQNEVGLSPALESDKPALTVSPYGTLDRHIFSLCDIIASLFNLIDLVQYIISESIAETVWMHI